MPIKIPSGLPARAILDSERIFALEKPEAERQRVRPLKLVILNLMPKKIETETQLLRLISKSPLQVEIDFMKTSTHEATHVSADHLVKFYENLDAFKDNYYDGFAGALAGTTYPLDREYTAKLLDFDGPTLNSMDSVSDRDYLIELLSALSTIAMHLSRFSEEIIIWNTNEYRFVEIDDSYSTGSSIMPQKKNPDIAELIRGKSGRVYGALVSMLTTMKGLPLAYDKDMQEDKELTFDAIDTVKGCLSLFTGMISSMKFRKDVMEASAKNGFTNATDAADYLVNHGVPFRDAHGIVGQLVLLCIDKGIALDDLPLEEYKKISPVFEEDVYEAISMKTCVEKRMTIGAPGPEMMKKVIEIYKKQLEQ